MSEILIKTKLRQPRAAAGLIARPRLLRWLDEQPGRQLTLVIAPAGYGKTTIVSQWLQERMKDEGRRMKPGGDPDSHPSSFILHPSFAWVSLDEEDNDLGRCWRYLLAAVQRAYPGSCPETAALLEAAQLPPPQYLADELANELADLPGPLALVLDDYHRIDGQPVHEAFSRLVAYLPSNVQLVVTSRVDVPWPLGRLRGQGHVTELRAVDLRFTEEEARALLARTLSVEQLDTAAAQLTARTEGWAVGLQLVNMSLRAAPDPQAFIAGLRGTNRNIADYLLDEVLGQQREDIRRSLLILAVPERFCQLLCDYLLEDAPGGGGQVVAPNLERQGLFLVALDEERTWYRFHHLVRDLLAARLVEVVGPEQVAALHRRVSLWFADREEFDEAIGHALQSGDYGLVAQLVERSYQQLLERENGLLRLKALLAQLPPEVLQLDPRLLLVQGYDAYLRMDFQTMGQMADLAMARLDERQMPLDETAGLRGDIGLLGGIVSFWGGDQAATALHTEQACRLIPRTRPFVRALAVTYRAGAWLLAGDGEHAADIIAAQFAEGIPTMSKAGEQLLVALLVTHFFNGRLDRLAQDGPLLAADRAGQNLHFLCWGHYMLGLACYEQNDLDAAREHWRRASAAPYHALAAVHHNSLVGLARIALAGGDHAGAAALGREARTYAEERASPMLLEASVALEAGLTLAAGNLAGAAWLAQAIDSAQYVGTSFWLEQPQLRRAQTLVLQATPTSLAEALHDLLIYMAEVQRANNIPRQIQAGILLALAHEAGGDGEEALEVLATAVGLGAPRGFVRSFVDAGPPLAALLRRLLPESPHEAFIRRVLGAFARSAAPAVALRSAAPSPLTRREQDILELLAERLTDQEIGERLIISITTVRTHTRRIYGKLEVRSRRQAIERARQLGLLTTVNRSI